MKALFLTYFDICLLKRGPEWVPTHPLFIAMLIGAYLLIGVSLSLAVGEEIAPLAAATHTVVSMAALAGLVWFLLYMHNLDRRFPATISALYGCDFLLSLLLFALLLLFGGVQQGPGLAATGVIGIWSIAVSGYILARALGASLWLGILLSIGISLISVALGNVAAMPA